MGTSFAKCFYLIYDKKKMPGAVFRPLKKAGDTFAFTYQQNTFLEVKMLSSHRV